MEEVLKEAEMPATLQQETLRILNDLVAAIKDMTRVQKEMLKELKNQGKSPQDFSEALSLKGTDPEKDADFYKDHPV